MGFFSDIHHLPLGWLGLKHIPAVPIELDGLLDTAFKLYERTKQTEPAKQGLTNRYTINAKTATGIEFLYGERPEAKLQKALKPLMNDLGKSPRSVVTGLYGSLSEKKATGAADEDLSSLEKLSLESADQWSISWTNHDDVYKDYKHLIPEWEKSLTDADEASRQFWPMIAENGFAYNLLILKKARTMNLPDLKKQFGSRWRKAWEKLSDDGLLYYIDLSIFGRMKVGEMNGFPRFTPSTITLLQQDPDTKDLTPIAIRVAGPNDTGTTIFVRGHASDSGWLYALQAVKVSVTVYGIWLGHVYHWHMITAAMQMTMYNNFDKQHAIYKLIAPQANYLFQFDEIMFLLWDSIAPPTSFDSAWSFLELTDAFAEGRGYFEDDPLTTLQNNGIEKADFSVNDDWDKYPIVVRFETVWHATRTYIDAFVHNTYANDALVAEDQSLQDWMRDASSRDDGNIKGLPTVGTREALSDVLTSLIYRITVHGASRLKPSAYPAQTFVANYPPCLQIASIPKPDVQLSTAELMEYLPKTGTIGDMMTFYTTFIFSEPYEPFIPKKGPRTKLFFPGGMKDPRNKALVAFRKAIIEVIHEYEPDEPQIHQWPMNIET